MDFIRKEPIEEGWSGHRKYKAVTADGAQYFLRVMSKEKDAKRMEELHGIEQNLEAKGLPLSRPIALESHGSEVYVIETWVDGLEAEKVIPSLTTDKQYDYGWEAGRILNIIHQIPAPDTQEDWEGRFSRKMEYKIRSYEQCPIEIPGGEEMISYIKNHRHLLKGRPQTFQHGDYHIGNMMIEKERLVVIDFERYDYGDPWEEFNRIVWSAQAAPAFATGMVDGYFNGQAPMEFWKLLALYVSSNLLGSVSWAFSFGEEERKTMEQQAKDVSVWYDNMNRLIPSWYQKYHRE